MEPKIVYHWTLISHSLYFTAIFYTHNPGTYMWALHLMDINLDRMAALKQAPFVIMKIPPWLKTLSTGTVVAHTYKIFVITL